MERVLGVDLGGTHLRAAAADAHGEVVAEMAEPANHLTSQGFTARVCELVDELCGAAAAAVAVGLPGSVSPSGELRHVANAPALNGSPIRSLLQERLDMPIIVENDVNLAALGEQRHGRGSGVRDLAFLAVGTGIGLGIVAGGRILRGARGAAGEIGLLPLSPDRVAGDPAGLGPLEVVAAGAGLAERWRAHTGEAATARDVFDAAATGDRAAVGLLEEQAVALAMAVRAVQAFLDPELIVFGGGMGARPDVLARVRTALTAHGTPPPLIELSALGERAGLVGALEVALQMTGDVSLSGLEP